MARQVADMTYRLDVPSNRGTQGLFSVKYMFGEANIA